MLLRDKLTSLPLLDNLTLFFSLSNRIDLTCGRVYYLRFIFGWRVSWSCTVQYDDSSFHASPLFIGAECNGLEYFF